ncbi:MAG: transcriptional repressor [Candidatus Schekmanbacteria bacterium GWA2_38_11]|uniref:Transcriptional repressor n=1 Tax=Candidatus Schekmanbacteria bacterium GWA2_38_11 TaxID=1817876 RepID=A0A1F7R9B0_9BACT|nr:MAG: transcriptional repressor [Candidatus Schekmanbacteria bacterium GWA2_38_11]
MKKLIEKHRKLGLKVTPQRLAILKYLDGNKNHPSAEDIFREIKKEYPTVSFATVYNTLQALRDKGEINEVTIDWEKKHYDPNPKPHHHIICTECNKIGDVFKDYSEALRLPGNIAEEFKPVRNHINFYGVCRDCQKKEKRRN